MEHILEESFVNSKKLDRGLFMINLKTPYETKIYYTKPDDFCSKTHVAACYICCNEQYLILYRAEGKPQEFTWGVPAGKVEAGERPREAVIRETWEETSIKLDDKRLREIGILYVRYPHIDFTYHMFAEDFSLEPEVVLSAEHIEYRWLKVQEIFKLPLISGAREAFLYMLDALTPGRFEDNGKASL
jgi:8-oxo-dGTP diphosphatase